MTNNTVEISFGDDVLALATSPLYQQTHLANILYHVLTYIADKITNGLVLPYFMFDDSLDGQDWINLPKSLDIYICDSDEGRELNLDARGKDYATNILSYPSGLPNELFTAMKQIPLGELVICHDVLLREATEQGKSVDKHLTHLVVHGILHLLGFDHELGQDEQDEMEGFEIEILAELGVSNPYD